MSAILLFNDKLPLKSIVCMVLGHHMHGGCAGGMHGHALADPGTLQANTVYILYSARK